MAAADFGSKPQRTAAGVRARVRAEMTAEIKAAATQQLATKGAAALSLRAITRELGLASSAIYRYFASREGLLTALIIDAYNDLGEQVEAAEAKRDRTDYKGRFLAVASAMRTWALANPNEYALIYGSPIPGYSAPEDTVDPATRIPAALIQILVDLGPTGEKSEELDAALSQLMDLADGQINSVVLAKGVEVWAELFGLVSLELFGQFNNAVSDPELFFGHATSEMANRLVG